MSSKKRKCFSVAEKAFIIEKASTFHGTKIELAKSLGLAVSTLQTILKQKDSIESSCEKLGNNAKKRKTLKSSPYDELESVLVDFGSIKLVLQTYQ